MSESILVTGAAGFIGMHVAHRLLNTGASVVGIDNLNRYYDSDLKLARLRLLEQHDNFLFRRIDLEQSEELENLFRTYAFRAVVHLAAQAGVRYSCSNPRAYVQSNLVGFANILEACRNCPVEHLVYASSSSVYGANKCLPFAVKHRADQPINLYAASKKANELMAYSYSHLYGIAATGLRFFTVYGPWGRPDMAYFKFAELMSRGQPIQVYNHGQMRRDFTYVDDVAAGIQLVLNHPPRRGETRPSDDRPLSGDEPPHRVYNLGNERPETLGHLIELLEQELGIVAARIPLPLQSGDMIDTFSDMAPMRKDFDFAATTTLAEGIRKFVAWYRSWTAARDAAPRVLAVMEPDDHGAAVDFSRDLGERTMEPWDYRTDEAA
jgi:UDP-glucuronate 4-epimerase